MTAGKEQDLSLPLKFLGKGKFKAELYVDDLHGGPTAVTHAVKSLSSDEKLPVVMPRSGGFVARIANERP
jgi:alpha-glucosidase